MTLSQAFEIYCSQIAVSELIGKSEALKRAWRKAKTRAVTNFIALNGDLAMQDITRDHARAFYMWWMENNTPEQAMLGDFLRAVDDAILESSDAHQKQMPSLLSNPQKALLFKNIVFSTYPEIVSVHLPEVPIAPL